MWMMYLVIGVWLVVMLRIAWLGIASEKTPNKACSGLAASGAPNKACKET